jgi:nucleotide-binding universal stress UspA family protein
MDETRPVIVGVDGSATSLDALREARRMAEALKAPLKVVAAWEYPYLTGPMPPPYEWNPRQEAQQLLTGMVHAVFGDDVPSGVEPVLAEGSPARVLVDLSAEAQMVVVGSRGRGGFTGLLLGSVSSEVGAHAQCPVLITHRRNT